VFVERTGQTSSQVEVLERVLDKGIVIDASMRVALMGIDLVTVEALVVIASIQTYLESVDAVALSGGARSRIDAVTSGEAYPRYRHKTLETAQGRRVEPPGDHGKSGPLRPDRGEHSRHSPQGRAVHEERGKAEAGSASGPGNPWPTGLGSLVGGTASESLRSGKEEEGHHG